MMNASLIDNENAGTVMAWCAVGTLVIGATMAIYQIYNQQKQQKAMEEARSAVMGLSSGQEADAAAA